MTSEDQNTPNTNELFHIYINGNLDNMSGVDTTSNVSINQSNLRPNATPFYSLRNQSENVKTHTSKLIQQIILKNHTNKIIQQIILKHIQSKSCNKSY